MRFQSRDLDIDMRAMVRAIATEDQRGFSTQERYLPFTPQAHILKDKTQRLSLLSLLKSPRESII